MIVSKQGESHHINPVLYTLHGVSPCCPKTKPKTLERLMRPAFSPDRPSHCPLRSSVPANLGTGLSTASGCMHAHALSFFRSFYPNVIPFVFNLATPPSCPFFLQPSHMFLHSTSYHSICYLVRVMSVSPCSPYFHPTFHAPWNLSFAVAAPRRVPVIQ